MQGFLNFRLRPSDPAFQWWWDGAFRRVHEYLAESKSFLARVVAAPGVIVTDVGTINLYKDGSLTWEPGHRSEPVEIDATALREGFQQVVNLYRSVIDLVPAEGRDFTFQVSMAPAQEGTDVSTIWTEDVIHDAINHRSLVFETKVQEHTSLDFRFRFREGFFPSPVAPVYKSYRDICALAEQHMVSPDLLMSLLRVALSVGIPPEE